VPKWIVRGIDKVRGNLVPIKDEVTTSKRDSGTALRKARVQHKRAPELSVEEILSKHNE
jgi:hypothetical protein